MAMEEIGMFENIMNFFKKLSRKDGQSETKKNKDEAKERLHLVLMQDRANVSADFLDMMRQEIIDVIKKYIDVDEKEIDVTLTNKSNGDGTNGVPALYANIPIKSIKNDINVQKIEKKQDEKDDKKVNNDNNNREENKKVATKKKVQSNEEDNEKEDVVKENKTKEKQTTKKK